jgi:hypothetical protein
MLSTFVNENKGDWDDILPYIMMAYRATPHISTKCSPNLLMFGREIQCPLNIMVGIPPENPHHLCPSLYVNWLEMSMDSSFEFAHQNLGISAQRQTQYYDRGLKPREFDIGDWVWRWYLPAISNELGQGWTFPYLVLRKISNVKYEIQLHSQSKPIVVHVDHLKPYQGRQPPDNWLE